MAIALAGNVPAAYHYDGIYAPSEVSSYLLVGIRAARKRPPSNARILRWIRSGLVAPERSGTAGRRLFLNFEDLVTCQAIALLNEAGFSMQAIRKAERVFADLYGVPKPFAHFEFWHGQPDFPHIFGRLDGHLVSGTKPGQLALSFIERWVKPVGARLKFSRQTGSPICWQPRNRILLRPDVQFGQPCIKGTRIPTSTLWGYVKGGDSVEYIARSFRLEPSDVRTAYQWEERRRAKLQAPAKVLAR